MKRRIKGMGFTLVELLVVITIIGILIALLLPAVQAAREAARRIQCANKFKQVGLALHNYHTAIGSFPPALFEPSSNNTKYANAPWWFGWGIYILPYMEQQALYDMYDFNRSSTWGWNSYWNSGSGKNRTASGTKVSGYLCPSDPTDGEGVWTSGAKAPQCGMTNMCAVSDSTMCYLYVGGVFTPLDFPINDGIFGANQGCTIADIKDGTSNTLMIGEVAGSGKGEYRSRFWASLDLGYLNDGINGITSTPGGATSFSSNSLKISGFSSFHPGGCHFAFADGSVNFISHDIADAVLKALATRDGLNRRSYRVPSTEVLVSGAP